jgi:hypothetical protein
VTLSPDEEKLFDGAVAGMDGPSMTRVGPALVELSSFFASGPNVWLKVHVPPSVGMGHGRSRALIAVKSVADPGGAELYDAKSNFERPFFHAFDLTETKSGVHRLQGIRSVRLVKGTTEARVHKVQGVLSLALPLEVETATFRAADAGKSRALAGTKVSALKLAGAEATIEIEGPAENVFDVRGYDAKGPVPRQSSASTSAGGKAQRTLRFRSPVERIDVLVARRFAKRDYPFTVVRGERPAPLPESLAKAAPKPAAPAVVVAKAAPPPPPPPPPVAKVARAPVPAAVPSPPPAPRPAVVTPVRSGPTVPGPKYADLMTAVMYRDAAGVEELLAFGKWPDKPDSLGMTPLAAAVMLGDRASAEALLKGGADPGTASRMLEETNDPAMRALFERYKR